MGQNLQLPWFTLPDYKAKQINLFQKTVLAVWNNILHKNKVLSKK